MRISDWSSDVCSSDLRRRRPERREILPDPRFGDVVLSKFMNSVMLDGKKSVAEGIVYGALESVEARAKKEPIGVFQIEEHTSELQSLMRISYAVFCLKKKKKKHKP